ncbi:hypothetical protein Syun_006676 [Stephania yunnanensis]|uniref:Uncharacterized protein n=1 Tax=Stephania yunnanensis TaxID=152371 RepID=A0AAP0KZN1_9MAGN
MSQPMTTLSLLHFSTRTTPPAIIPGPATGSSTTNDQDGYDDDDDDDDAPTEPPRDRNGRVIKIPLSLDKNHKCFYQFIF